MPHAVTVEEKRRYSDYSFAQKVEYVLTMNYALTTVEGFKAIVGGLGYEPEDFSPDLVGPLILFCWEDYAYYETDNPRALFETLFEKWQDVINCDWEAERP